jgi:hypothetical protein
LHPTKYQYEKPRAAPPKIPKPYFISFMLIPFLLSN